MRVGNGKVFCETFSLLFLLLKNFSSSSSSSTARYLFIVSPSTKSLMTWQKARERQSVLTWSLSIKTSSSSSFSSFVPALIFPFVIFQRSNDESLVVVGVEMSNFRMIHNEKLFFPLCHPPLDHHASWRSFLASITKTKGDRTRSVAWLLLKRQTCQNCHRSAHLTEIIFSFRFVGFCRCYCHVLCRFIWNQLI